MATRAAAGDFTAALSLVDPSVRDVLAPAVRQAFIGGFEGVLLVAGVAALVFAVLVGTLLGRPMPVHEPLPA